MINIFNIKMTSFIEARNIVDDMKRSLFEGTKEHDVIKSLSNIMHTGDYRTAFLLLERSIITNLNSDMKYNDRDVVDVLQDVANMIKDAKN